MWSTICTIHDLCNWLWFAGCGENCKCFVYVCVRFWTLLKSFALYCIFWRLFLFIVVWSVLTQPAIFAMTALCPDGTARLLLPWTTMTTTTAAKCHYWGFFLFIFFHSATLKSKWKTKWLCTISPIRNRLEIKLWKFSGSVVFEVCRQKTEGRLFLERYYLFAPFLSFLFVFFPLYFPNKDHNDDLIMITLPLWCAQTLPFTRIWGKDWC